MFDTATIIAWLQGIMAKVCDIQNLLNERDGGLYSVATSQSERIMSGGDFIIYDNPYVNFNDKLSYDSDTGIFTVLEDGYYDVEFNVSLTESTSADDFYFELAGYNIGAYGEGSSTGATVSEVNATGIMECNAGDTFAVVFVGTQIQLGGLPQQSRISIHWIGKL